MIQGINKRGERDSLDINNNKLDYWHGFKNSFSLDTYKRIINNSIIIEQCGGKIL